MRNVYRRYEEKVAGIKNKYSCLAQEIRDKKDIDPEKDVLDSKQNVNRESLQKLVRNTQSLLLWVP